MNRRRLLAAIGLAPVMGRGSLARPTYPKPVGPSLPYTVSGRLEVLSGLVSIGAITAPQALRLLDLPDHRYRYAH